MPNFPSHSNPQRACEKISTLAAQSESSSVALRVFFCYAVLCCFPSSRAGLAANFDPSRGLLPVAHCQREAADRSFFGRKDLNFSPRPSIASSVRYRLSKLADVLERNFYVVLCVGKVRLVIVKSLGAFEME